MKVYWTKTLKYSNREIIDLFCKKHDLTKEWRRSPKSHYVLIDALDREDMYQTVFDFVGEDVRVTSRSNDVAVMKEAKSIIYNAINDGCEEDDLKDIMHDTVKRLEKKWRGKADLDALHKYMDENISRVKGYMEKIESRARRIFIGDGKIVLVGAYENINGSRGERLMKLASFLDGMLDTDCIIYDHKGTFYLIPCDENYGHTSMSGNKGKLKSVVEYNRMIIEKILQDDFYFRFDAGEFYKETLPRIRRDEGGGFLIVNSKNNACISRFENDIKNKPDNISND